MVAAARGLRVAGFAVAVAAPATARPAPAHWSRCVLERLVVPDPLDDEPGFVAALERVLASGRYAALVAGSDASLLHTARARDRLERYTSPAFPGSTVVVRILDKVALASAASRHELASPRMIVCRAATEAAQAARELGFPAIVKPVRSVIEQDGARRQLGSVSVANELELQTAVRAIGERCLVQRTEAGTVTSFAGVFADGGLIGEAFSRYHRTWHPEAGNASFSETFEPTPELRERVVALLRELCWEGSVSRADGPDQADGVACSAVDLNPGYRAWRRGRASICGVVRERERLPGTACVCVCVCVCVAVAPGVEADRGGKQAALCINERGQHRSLGG